MANKRSSDAVSGAVLIAYIDAHTTAEGSNNKKRINGHAISETLARALYRWRKENVQPRVNKVEEALQKWDLTFRNFEEWAAENEQCIWFNGAAPDWWEDESESRWREDLKSDDPEWRAEAEAYGIAIGEIKPKKRRRPMLDLDAEEITITRREERVPVAA